jgi:hypothetical protein
MCKDKRRGASDKRVGDIEAERLAVFRLMITLYRAWLGLRDPHVPKNRRCELENVPDVLTEGGRLEPFAPRHVRHLAESDLLDLVGELLSLRLISRAPPSR